MPDKSEVSKGLFTWLQMYWTCFFYTRALLSSQMILHVDTEI